MSVIQALILGILQGLTEFLPVSSSGHLVMFQRIMGIDEPTLSFNIAVHFATLVAVFIVFKNEIWKIIKNPISPIVAYIIIATIPAGLVGVFLSDYFTWMNDTGLSVGFGFIVTGSVVFIGSRFLKGKKTLDQMNWCDALLIGIAQAVAIFPGVSRSGMTLTGGLMRKFERKEAVTFAFLIAIPAILGATLIETLEVVRHGLDTINVWPLLVGMIAAGLSGYFAIKLFVKIVMKGKIIWFSIYVGVLAVLVLMDQIFFGIFFERFF